MKTCNYAKILEEVYQETTPYIGRGEAADYIPELKSVPLEQFGMAICDHDGFEYVIGNGEKNFSIQSISKAFTFSLAYKEFGQKLWGRVGREPSGDSFNSLILLETENGIPRNPFINAGALVITDHLISCYDNPVDVVLKFMQDLSGNPNITINEKVKNSEVRHADRNHALAYFMKSFGNIESDIQTLVETYTAFCAIEMSCVDLARAFSIYSNGGFSQLANKRILSVAESKRINSVYMTCGLYNSVGDFAYRVGFPAKSGVGGGIVGAIPGSLSVCSWSPGLDENGNSVAAFKALELFTTKASISIY